MAICTYSGGVIPGREDHRHDQKGCRHGAAALFWNVHGSTSLHSVHFVRHRLWLDLREQSSAIAMKDSSSSKSEKYSQIQKLSTLRQFNQASGAEAIQEAVCRDVLLPLAFDRLNMAQLSEDRSFLHIRFNDGETGTNPPSFESPLKGSLAGEALRH